MERCDSNTLYILSFVVGLKNYVFFQPKKKKMQFKLQAKKTCINPWWWFSTIQERKFLWMVFLWWWLLCCCLVERKMEGKWNYWDKVHVGNDNGDENSWEIGIAGIRSWTQIIIHIRVESCSVRCVWCTTPLRCFLTPGKLIFFSNFCNFGDVKFKENKYVILLDWLIINGISRIWKSNQINVKF